MENTNKQSFFRRLWNKIKPSGNKEINVYFISGMCYNCSVFDGLKLPRGYKKVYIEWEIPQLENSLSDYTRKIAENIDVNNPFILVGYSFGGVIVQEMLKFLSPVKSIIVSSFKTEYEIPSTFYVARKTRVLRRTPLSIFSTEFITKAFNKVIYDLPSSELALYMTVTDPVYIKWSAIQITEWIPATNNSSFYHIHGTEDQIFSFDKLGDVYPVEGGDHLMIIKKSEEVNHIMNSILLKKE
jgi:hypothetical protein